MERRQANISITSQPLSKLLSARMKMPPTFETCFIGSLPTVISIKSDRSRSFDTIDRAGRKGNLLEEEQV